MQILGATKTILPYARDYARYILFAAPVFTASMVLSSILRAEGKARFSMIGIMVGGILNCGLDPLFIFTFGMGVGGAAIATALSQLVSLCILLVPFILGRTVTRLGIRRASVRVATYRRIITLGLPSFLRQSLATVATMALNLSAAAFGDTAVAAMSIVGRLVMFVFSITIGFAQGYQPVLGYNYGAGQILRVRQAFAFTFKVCLGIMTAGGLGGFFAAPWLMRLFIARDPEVVRIGTLALRAQCIAMPFVPMGIMANMTYQSIGKSWTATFLSAARQGIFFLPLILLLPPLLGLTGVQITQALADFATFWLCIPFVLRFYRTLGQNSSGGSELRAVPSAHKEQGFDTQG
jgi:putative MATE family efflux protein